MKTLLLATFLFSMVGCTHLYKLYEYEEITLESEFGRIRIYVLGEWNKVSQNPEITEYTSPYTARIGFITSDLPGKDIMIKVNQVGPSSKEVSYFNANKIQKTEGYYAFLYKDEGYNAGCAVLISEIESNYDPINLSFELHYNGIIENYDVVLNPNYKEENRSNIVSGIMGI